MLGRRNRLGGWSQISQEPRPVEGQAVQDVMFFISVQGLRRLPTIPLPRPVPQSSLMRCHRSDWPGLVLLFSTLMCCQLTELILCLFFCFIFNYTPPAILQLMNRWLLQSPSTSRSRLVKCDIICIRGGILYYSYYYYFLLFTRHLLLDKKGDYIEMLSDAIRWSCWLDGGPATMITTSGDDIRPTSVKRRELGCQDQLYEGWYFLSRCCALVQPDYGVRWTHRYSPLLGTLCSLQMIILLFTFIGNNDNLAPPHMYKLGAGRCALPNGPIYEQCAHCLLRLPPCRTPSCWPQELPHACHQGWHVTLLNHQQPYPLTHEGRNWFLILRLRN